MSSPVLKTYFITIGRRGGRAKSQAKIEAACRNLIKARKTRAQIALENKREKSLT